jgi:hypothetical protein
MAALSRRRQTSRPATERPENALPDGPGLFRRWLLATPAVAVGLVLPMVVADGLTVWQNWIPRNSPLTDVIRDLIPAMDLWTGLALVAGLVALLVSRLAVTAWPKICLLTMTPTLVAFVLVGAVSGLVSDNRLHLLYLLDIPVAAGLAAGGFLLVRTGVRRLIEPAALDTIGTGLDVRIPVRDGADLLLRHDRMVITEDGERSVISWYDYRTVRAGQDEEPGVEVLAASQRRFIPMAAARVQPVLAAIVGRTRYVRGKPMFQVRRENYRRMGSVPNLVATRATAKTLSNRWYPGSSAGLSPMGFAVLLMVTMPVAAIVLAIAATQTGGSQQKELVLGAAAAAAIGLWAHIRFWRRRAARRYLETRPDR